MTTFIYTLIIYISPLIIGWLLDLLLGDPTWLPHPIVWMGRWISFGEKHWNKDINTHDEHKPIGNERKGYELIRRAMLTLTPKSRVQRGAVFAIVSVTGVFILTMTILIAARIISPIAYIVIASIMVFYCLAGHTLRQEVKMVFEAADSSLEEGRKQVARIVGRDTSELSDNEVRTAALETLAENTSDGVIAPIFWVVFAGVPGMMTYKMVNTLDSMIGYQNDRYRDFGRWAAKIDDVANYLPARITAYMMLAAAWVKKNTDNTHYSFFSFEEGQAFLKKYAHQHASPNSGWPESALAYLLNCRFGGPHYYFGEYFYKPYIGHNKRELDSHDVAASTSLCFLAEVLAVASAFLIQCLESVVLG